MPFRGVTVLILCTVGLCGLVGCGESDPLGRKAISGTVNLNGAPVEQGNIAFQPMDTGATSSGAVIAAGKYAIERQKGLPKGKYRVTVNAPKPGTGKGAGVGVMPGDPLPPPEELIPPEWNVNSEQTIEVTDKGPYVFNFDIQPKGK